MFARDHGRLAVLARGARRPRSALRGVLLAFQPWNWAGSAAVKSRPWPGPNGWAAVAFLRGEGLLLGYYLNELLLKLLPREDAHLALFDAYAAALAALAQGGVETAELRRFEKALLKELGYGLVLEREAGGRAVEAEMRYRYQVERGAVRESEAESGQVVSGKTLLDLAADDYADPRSLAESKQLMRHLLAHHLSGQQLQTRRVFIELQDV